MPCCIDSGPIHAKMLGFAGTAAQQHKQRSTSRRNLFFTTRWLDLPAACAVCPMVPDGAPEPEAPLSPTPCSKQNALHFRTTADLPEFQSRTPSERTRSKTTPETQSTSERLRPARPREPFERPPSARHGVTARQAHLNLNV
eukprot:15035445-Alexandrium_andersonii.AAC.1